MVGIQKLIALTNRILKTPYHSLIKMKILMNFVFMQNGLKINFFKKYKNLYLIFFIFIMSNKYFFVSSHIFRYISTFHNYLDNKKTLLNI